MPTETSEIETTTIPTDPEAQAAADQAEIDAQTPEQTDDERLEALEEHDQQMRRIADRVTDLKMKLAVAKEEASQLKKAHDAAQDELHDMARRKLSAGPLFDQPEEATEAWRFASVNELADHGATLAEVKKLTDKAPPIKTLGELSDYLSDDYRKLTDIEGIGPKAAEAIEDALAAWFAAHPDECPPVRSADDIGGDDDDEYEPVNY